MSLLLRGPICYSGDGRYKGNVVGDGVPGRNNPVEISSAALALRQCVCDAVRGAKGFCRVCRVAQNALSSPAGAVQ